MSKLEKYKALQKAIKKFEDIMSEDSAIDIRYQVNNAVSFFELSEKFDIDFGNPKLATNFEVRSYTRVFQWGERSQISWSDDGRQPETGEYVYVISFPTGAYIFGEHYPQDLFQQFFLELKSYNPKYLDTVNKSLYFSVDNAKVIHKDFPDILQKYQDQVREDYKRIRKEKLEKELRELEDV